MGTKAKQKLKRARRDQPQPKQQKEEKEEEQEAELEALGFDDALAAGLAFEQLGALEGAAEAFAVALQRRPGHFEALTRFADALVATGEHEQAAERYRQASEADEGKEDASVWFRLGMALAALDKDADAVESFKKSIALSEKTLDAEDEGAVKAYSVALAALANCYGEQGDLDAAVEVFQGAAKRLPENGNLHYNLANMRMARAGEKFDAKVVEALECAIKCSPDTRDFYEDLVAYLEQHMKQPGRVKELRSMMKGLREEQGEDRKRKRSESDDENDEDDQEEDEEEDDSEEDDEEEVDGSE